MAFPSHEFGGQEYKKPKDIRAFVQKYGIEFPMMQAVSVNGADAHPVWQWLKSVAGGDDVRWNFATKFLVSRDGVTARRYEGTNPHDMADDIERLLLEDAPAPTRSGEEL